MSIEAFRAKVVAGVRNAAHAYLCAEKLEMSKIMYVNRNKFEFQSYLNPSILNIDEAKLMFQLRSRMVENNYSNRYDDTLCPVCNVENDTQEHVFKCTKLQQSKNIIVDSIMVVVVVVVVVVVMVLVVVVTFSTPIYL